MKLNTQYALTAMLPLVLLVGCASQPQKLQQRDSADPTPPVNVTRNVQPVAPDEYARTPEVVRYDRYLLVSTDPQAAQRNPLSWIIDIRIPASLHPTVADALRYALKQSGYSLCATGPANGVLYRQPLPAVSKPAALNGKPRPARRATPTVRNAPFVLTGIERRGADSWVAVAPRGYSGLSQITLIGEGETVAGWTRVSVGNGKATFRVNGRVTDLKVE